MSTISYAKQWIGADDIKAVVKCLGSGHLTQGPMVGRFEKAIARYCNARYAVAVNSGTAALHISCLAAGIKQGDEGITSAITFAATSNAMLYCGAKPVFADIDAETLCIDPSDIASKVTRRTRVLIPVHFAGHPCDMDKISRLAKKGRITVIEDACHALGTRFRNTRIGDCRYSDMTVFSFHAVKNVTTGEGGIITTNDPVLYRRLLLLRSHGITRDKSLLKDSYGPWHYEMHMLGFNYRITDIQCALGLSQLKKLERFNERRRLIAERYTCAFSKMPEVSVQAIRPYVRPAYHLYVIRFDLEKLEASKSEVYTEYNKHCIIPNVHYMPVYKHPYYRAAGYGQRLCPNAENYYEQAFTLPMYPRMRDKDVSKVIDVTRHIVDKYLRRSDRK